MTQSRPDSDQTRKKTKLRPVIAVLGIAFCLYAAFFLIFKLVWQNKMEPKEPLLDKPNPIAARATLPASKTYRTSRPARLTASSGLKKRNVESADEEIVSDVQTPRRQNQPENSNAELPPRQIPLQLSERAPLVTDKCWDDGGLQHPGTDCAELGDFRERLYERLYVALECAQNGSENSISRVVYAGLELDFTQEKISFWPTDQSDESGTRDFFNCLNKRFEGFPFRGLTPKFDRYHLSFALGIDTAKTVAMGRVEHYALVEKKQGDEGLKVRVSRDRVRLRAKPVDGEIMGFVSTGQTVRMIGSHEGWCLVQTERRTRGWMVCWGLALD